MTERGLQATDIPAPPPPPSQPDPTQQPTHPTQQVQQPTQLTQQGQQLVHLNWSHFKPEFSGKPEENTEVHLLRTNDWMDAHHFQKTSKFKDFV